MSLAQLKVMSAIKSCRTSALGGHVERCEDCAHTRIAYNSCRNRHCPKCQAAATRQWLEDREAELLPVPYYHVVFTLPASIGALQRSRAEAGGEAEDVAPARRCPCCGGRMIVVETFEGPRPARSPSPSRIRIDTS